MGSFFLEQNFCYNLSMSKFRLHALCGRDTFISYALYRVVKCHTYWQWFVTKIMFIMPPFTIKNALLICYRYSNLIAVFIVNLDKLFFLVSERLTKLDSRQCIYHWETKLETVKKLCHNDLGNDFTIRGSRSYIQYILRNTF